MPINVFGPFGKDISLISKARYDSAYENTTQDLLSQEDPESAAKQEIFITENKNRLVKLLTLSIPENKARYQAAKDFLKKM